MNVKLYISLFKSKKLSQKKINYLFKKIIGEFTGKKYLKIDNFYYADDMKQEYWIGVMRGIEKVDLSKSEKEIIFYIRKSGWGFVLEYIRSNTNKNSYLKCKCGTVQRITRNNCISCETKFIKNKSNKNYEMLPKYINTNDFNNFSFEEEYQRIEDLFDLNAKFNLLYDNIESKKHKEFLIDIIDPNLFQGNIIKNIAQKRGVSDNAISKRLEKVKKIAQKLSI